MATTPEDPSKDSPDESRPPLPSGNAAQQSPICGQFLISLFNQLPLLVMQVNDQGIVLECNVEAMRVSGYVDLVGRNLWSTLFPGRLFAQVPKFISVQNVNPPAPLRDVVMTMRTRQGVDRIIAWTRFVHVDRSGQRTLVMMGNDLTDRLLDADKEHTAGMGPSIEAGRAGLPFGANVGNGGTVEGEVVTPLAISPPSPQIQEGSASTGPTPIEQVQDYLMELDKRIGVLKAETFAGELANLAGVRERVAAGWGRGADALLALMRQLDGLGTKGAVGGLSAVETLVLEVITQCRHDRR